MRFAPWPAAAAAATLLSLACGSNEYAPPPPPEVTVARPEVRDVTLYRSYTGTTRAVQSVEVRARVKGFLLSMEFAPGEDVQKGDPLFVIDPEPFQVALDSAKASRAHAQAELDLAQTEVDRTQEMYEKQAASEINLIKLRAKRDKAASEVAAAEAEIRSAQLDLDYAHVVAPIDGRVGRHHVDIGNLVGASEATLLTEIVQYSPIYVFFHLSEQDLLEFQEMSHRRRTEGGRDYEERSPTPIQVGKGNEEGFPHDGVIDFTALEVDSHTGTFEVRGILENRGELDEIIVPGTFVRARVPVGRVEEALLVDDRALGADQGGRFVLVVGEDDVVEHRRVETGGKEGPLRVIRSGLEPDDRVIVNGIQRARPGSKVDARFESDTVPPTAEATRG